MKILLGNYCSGKFGLVDGILTITFLRLALGIPKGNFEIRQ